MKYWAMVGFVGILASLGVALFFMMKSRDVEHSAGRKMARALALRVALSILLFVGILLAWSLGYIEPTGIPVR